MMPTNVIYNSAQDLPTTLPIFPLSGAILFPRAQLPLNIFEPRYLNMIEDALKTNRLIGMIQPSRHAGDSLAPQHPSLARVGTVGRITEFAETGDGRLLITLTGIIRFSLEEELSVITPYRQARVTYEDYSADLLARAGEETANREAFLQNFRELAQARQLQVDWSGIEMAPTEAVINAISMMAPLDPDDKQALLEASDLATRADVFMALATMAVMATSSEKRTLQ